MLRVTSLGALAVLLCACGDDGGSPGGEDAGPIDIDSGPADAGWDAGPVPSELFGPCYTDEQCPGPDAVCRKPVDGWPEGYCTRECPGGDRTPCDDGLTFNHCLEQEDGSGFFCEKKCLNGLDCRDSYTCTGSFDAMGNGICVGLCSSDEDCGGGADVACNEWSGQCMAASDIPASGSETGGTCEDDDGCLSGNCLAAYDPGFSGWNGGYCLGFCLLPQGYNMNTFWGGNEEDPADALPQGTCPGDNTVCFPNGSYARGDLGVCLAGCSADSDCRDEDAYYCLKDIDLASGDVSSYTRGVCLPMSCRFDECPTGFECRTLSTSSGSIYRCEKL